MKKLPLLFTTLALAACLTAGVSISALAAPETYKNYVNVKAQGSGLVLEPTLIYEPSDESALDGSGYASVVVTPDAEMNVDVGRERPFRDLFELKIKGKSIPVLRIDGNTVQPFLDWLNKTYTVSDIMAISKDVAVLEKIYADEKGYLVNTVYDLTDTELSSDRYAEWEHIAAANKAGCNILLYGVQENLSVAAEYVSAMSKVCWAQADTEEECVQAIAAGCYGVLSKDKEALSGALSYFKEEGFARAQYVAAHRGITKYANEQSLTGVMASHNEGATHVEIDIQITKDGRLVSCHNSDIAYVSGMGGKYIINETLKDLKKIKLNNFSARYEESFATLEDICEVLQKTDVILIVELKLDSASQKAVEELKAIEKLKEVMDRYPGMKGHWITITFYSPYAKDMKRILPEIPCCFLGAGLSTMEKENNQTQWDGEHKSLTDLGGKIGFLRKRNIGLDEMTYDNENDRMDSNTNSMAQNYLARGYTLNTWTFEDCRHFGIKANIATTNAAEDCALLVKEVAVGVGSVTEAELTAKKATVPCRTYNGWVYNYECDVIEVSRTGNTAKVLYYYLQQPGDDKSSAYGIYSELRTVTVS